MEDEEYFKQRLVHTIKNYQEDSMNRLSYMQKALSNASLKHKELLLDSGFERYLSNIYNCVSQNNSLLQDVLQSSELQIENENSETKEQIKTYAMDFQRLNSCLLQIVREWSSIGQTEREKCFTPILEELKSRFPEDDRSDVQILVPGCGLARLPFEIALEGFQVGANEQDPFQLMTASFIINSDRINKFTIYPWIHDLSNRHSMDDVTSSVSFPDTDPSEIQECQFNVLPGNFVDVANEDELEDEIFDAIVTTFFIETAQNPLTYVDIIHRLLKPGGIWINFGSMNFVHDSPMAGNFLNLSLEMLKDVLKKEYKFKFERDEIVKSTYAAGPEQNTKVQLDCAFFICQKE